MNKGATVGHKQIGIGRIIFEPQPPRPRQQKTALGHTAVRANLKKTRIKRANRLEIRLDSGNIRSVLGGTLKRGGWLRHCGERRCSHHCRQKRAAR